MKKNCLLFKNCLRTMFIFSAVFLLVSASSAQDITEGLQIHYSFETSDGVNVQDMISGYQGVLTDGATIGLSEDGRNVLVLSGETNAFFDMEAAVGTKLQTLTDFTISTFVNLESLDTWSRIFDFGSGTDYYMFLSPISGNGTVRFSFKNGGAEEQINGTAPLAIGKWVHVAVSLEGSVGTLYIDGVPAGVNKAMTLNPLSIGDIFSQNYIGNSQWPDPFLKGQLSDFRVYDRALSADDMLVLAGTPDELVIQYNAFDLTGLEAVENNITLPTILGSNGVTVSWASSDTAVIDSVGNVTRPQSYNAAVILTATLELEVEGKMHTLVKSFNATVLALVPASDLVANWTFEEEYIDWSNLDSIKIKDLSDNEFEGIVMSDANIIKIGETNQFNVLDLGDGTGYFDMGAEIGEVMYELGEYTMACYFRINENYTDLNSNGNFIWNFSNTDDAPTDQNGYIIGSLKNQSVSITTNYWEVGDQGVGVWGNAAQGGWHHMAFTSKNSVGTVYIDGQVVATGAMTHLPSTALPQDTLTGTPYNWLGRSCYPGDVFLRQTLLYDFRIYAFGVSQDDILYGLEVDTYLNDLNAAYQENPNASFPNELTTEMGALDLGDLSALTSDITLPVTGTIDNSITITWTTSSGFISSTGMVTQPDFFTADVTLKATLTKRGHSISKEFPATVLVKEGTEYTSDLLLHYNFADDKVSGTTVTDASEKGFTGTLINGAVVSHLTDGTDTYNVLDLSNDTAYFDMGEECGKVIYGLKDSYSISVYFIADMLKPNFANNGNFVYAFSNSATSDVDRNGYMFGRASVGIHCVSSEYWAMGNQNTGDVPGGVSQGMWHNMVYVQNDTIGTVYFDGDTASSVTISNFPSIAIPKEGLTGTLFNYLGRPNFGGDVYLGDGMIHDFKIWNKQLTPEDVAGMQPMVANLDNAYAISSNVKDVTVKSGLNLDLSMPGQIRVLDLKGDERISLYDLSGRKIQNNNSGLIKVRSGLYIITVDEKVQKLFVK